MLNRFDADVIDLGPSLVIWQLGANDVLRYDSVRGLEPLMAGGMRRLAEKGIPVVLFDLQYAPKIIADTDHKAMTELIEKLARDYSAGLFRRFAIMRTLIENDPALPARVIESDGLHMTAAMHRCLGQLLASGIAESAQPELATRR